MRILLKQVRIVGDESVGTPVDILIENGTISSIGATPNGEVDREVSGEDLLVFPGWMDLGVQAWDPGHEHREDLDSVREAAAAGGYSALALWPDTDPVVDSKAGVRYVADQAEQHAVRLYPLGAVSRDCAGVDITEMIDMRQAGAIGFTDGLRSIRSNGLFMRALRYVTAFNGLIIHFPQDPSIGPNGQMHEGQMSTSLGLPGIPAIAEEVMVARDLHLLEYTNSRLHLANISTAGAVRRVREAKAAGLQVSASVPVWNLVYEDTVLESFDSQYKMLPPLRGQADREALLAGLLDGTIDHISTNHRPWEDENKSLEYPYAAFGATGLETTYSLLQMKVADQLTPVQLADLLGRNLRKLLHLPVPKITAGAEADLTICSPTEKWTYDRKAVRSRSYNNPLLGEELTGRVRAVIRGNQYKEIS